MELAARWIVMRSRAWEVEIRTFAYIWRMMLEKWHSVFFALLFCLGFAAENRAHTHMTTDSSVAIQRAHVEHWSSTMRENGLLNVTQTFKSLTLMGTTLRILELKVLLSDWVERTTPPGLRGTPGPVPDFSPLTKIIHGFLESAVQCIHYYSWCCSLFGSYSAHLYITEGNFSEALLHIFEVFMFLSYDGMEA